MTIEQICKQFVLLFDKKTLDIWTKAEAASKQPQIVSIKEDKEQERQYGVTIGAKTIWFKGDKI